MNADVLIIPPTVEPLSRTKAKLHLKSQQTAEDSLVDSWIAAARGQAERFMTRAIVLQTRRLMLDCLPGCIEILWNPVRSIQSIQYLDANNALQTLAADQYRVDKLSSPVRITPAYTVTWPTTYPVTNAVMVTYTAGMLLPFTADTADLLTVAGHGLADTDAVQVQPLGAGVLPTGLAVSTNYYVRDAAADTLKLSATSGGAAVDITAAGTPPNVIGRYDMEIEAALQLLVQYHEGRQAENALLEAAERLLEPFRIVRF